MKQTQNPAGIYNVSFTKSVIKNHSDCYKYIKPEICGVNKKRGIVAQVAVSVIGGGFPSVVTGVLCRHGVRDLHRTGHVLLVKC